MLIKFQTFYAIILYSLVSRVYIIIYGFQQLNAIHYVIVQHKYYA